MTRESLMRLNKQSLVNMIFKLEKENRLLRKDIIFTCMECGNEFQELENNLCPYCHSGNLAKEIIDEH